VRVGLYHGYELVGSGSNEYTRYLAHALAGAGHEVHVLCRENSPADIPQVRRALAWQPDGRSEQLFLREASSPGYTLHLLPHGPIRPVYLTDKQRAGNVKAFTDLNDGELAAYHHQEEALLRAILGTLRLDVLHANHLVYQPVAALGPCRETGTPLVIYPHGSAIEYTVKQDERYLRLAGDAIANCAGIIFGNHEVRDRVLALYPVLRDRILAKTRIVGVGVDTTLFQPVARQDRAAAIDALIATEGRGGKEPQQSAELRQRLAGGDLQATREYWDAYDHSRPDADLNAHLRRIPWDRNILLFVGALTVGKGLQTLISALPAILRTVPDTHLVIVGAGAYREVLEALVFAIATNNRELLLKLCAQGQDLDRSDQSGPWRDVEAYLAHEENIALLLKHGRDLDRHVHFLGRLDHQRLRHLFPCADLAVFPSVVPEAYPLVLMESLANGVLPVVSCFSGFADGVAELVPWLGEEITERMKISMDDTVRIESLAGNLAELLGEESDKERSRALRRIAEEHYDWRLRADQMTKAYSELVSD
jgi:glycosyltransferase involved in cell wall biosynthesis